MAANETLVFLFAQRLRNTPDKPALMERQGDHWVAASYKEWNNRSRAIATAMLDDGLEKGETTAIFSYSRREWVEADLATLLAGGVTSTIYHNLAGETVEHILQDAKPRIVFIEGPLQMRALTDASGTRKFPDSVKRIVYFQNRQTPPAPLGKPTPPEISLAEIVPESVRPLLISIEDYVRKGRDRMGDLFETLEQRIANIAPEDTAKIIYTSGTSGQPKGVMLSHANLCSVTTDLPKTVGIRPTDVSLLFLPLAHVYAQLVLHAQLRIGFTLAFARSMLTAVDDAQSLRPDFFVSVPRLFEKIYDTLMAKVDASPPLQRAIFNWASEVGNQVSAQRQQNASPGLALSAKGLLAERLVFSKLKATLGGRIRFMVSGGAALSPALLSFFHAADLLILEGYGMTENASLSHHNHFHRYHFGTVGYALNGVETLIADDGEILLRGPGVMKGYHNLPEDTREAIDDAGWLHTGDIGEIDANGCLKITDRKKDLIVTSGGKNIAPAPIEASLCRLKLINQAMLFGNNKNYVTALITLDNEAAMRWAKEAGLDVAEKDLYRTPQIIAAVEAQISSLNASLERYETIKKFAIAPREFSIDKGEMTPSLKLRRKVIAKNFAGLLNTLYTSVSHHP
ncbi:MAG: long-chain fatty acid--CoA ligase [Myxococcales bacterium]|jgi:long-chain acyl-CoA synthetase|nr:long-chain fatty acid--CoA ligase [Myxococcales bacterium]